MDERLPQRIYQGDRFTVNGFCAQKLEQLIAFAAVETPEHPVVVYLKTEGHDWQRFFPDAGIGCWEYADAETLMQEKEAGYVCVDYAGKYNLQGKRISSIYCERAQQNSRIVIALDHKERLLLRCSNAAITDSACELVLTRDGTTYPEVGSAGRSSGTAGFLSENKEND